MPWTEDDLRLLKMVTLPYYVYLNMYGHTCMYRFKVTELLQTIMHKYTPLYSMHMDYVIILWSFHQCIVDVIGRERL